MHKKVLITGNPLAKPAMDLAARAGVQLIPTRPYLLPDELKQIMIAERPDGLVVRSGQITKDIIAAGPALRVIAKHGVGYDAIDIAAATERGIPVLIAGGANKRSVAEHALGLMFGVAKATAHLDRRVRGGFWDQMEFVGTELSGKNLGIIGFGAVGSILADLVASFQMTVRVYDPQLPSTPAKQNVRVVKNLEELLRESDIISIHCPSKPQTRHMIGAEQLGWVKPTAILINTARGDIIDEAALITALRENRLAGAGLDTFECEPLPKDSPLLGFENVVLAPHVGASSAEAREGTGIITITQVLDVLDGRKPPKQNLVNPAALNVESGRYARTS